MSAIQIGNKSSVEEILKYSKEVMTTMGEWELVGLTVTKFQQPTGDEEFYEELRFFVRNTRNCSLLKLHIVHRFYSFTQQERWHSLSMLLNMSFNNLDIKRLSIK